MRTASQALTKLFLAPIALSALALLALPLGCEREEAPPPLPSAAPAATPPAEPLELAPEPIAVVDAGTDAGKKKTGTGKPGASLANCCSALQQNAANAPSPNKEYMLQAAGICSALAAQGKEKGSAIGAIQAALKGVGMPAACQ
jgi:hypothetical protein